MTTTIAASNSDPQLVLKKLHFQWNDKNLLKINEVLDLFFKRSVSPFLDCLDLIEFSKDKKKPNSLGNHIINKFDLFLQQYSCDSSTVTVEIKKRILKITTLSHPTLSVKLIHCFQVDQPSLDLVLQHIKDLSSIEKNFNAAITLTTALNLQEKFSIYELAVPVFLQNKLGLLEPYMKGSEKVQIEMIELLDSWLSQNFDLVTFFSTHGIRSVSEEVIRSSFQERMLTKWLKAYKKETDADNLCPNLCRRRAMGGVRYILYRYYTENSATFENTVDLLKKLVGDNEWLQDQLLDILQHTYQDYEAIDTFNSLFGRVQQSNFYLDPSQVVEEEDWGSEVAQHSSNSTLLRHKTLAVTDVDTRWHSQNENNFHSLSLSFDSIIFVDNTHTLEHCIDVVLKKSDIVGIDAEWLFLKNFSNKQEVALLQLATRSRVFLLDLMLLCHEEILIKEVFIFLKTLFESKTIVKVGYGVHDDLKKLGQSLGDKEIVSKHACRIIDLHTVKKHIAKLYPKIFVSPAETSKQVTGLSQLVLETIGLKLDKSEQISDWERRPLRKAQIKYAALDAYCLVEVYDILTSRLKAENADLTLENVIKSKLSFPKQGAIGRGRGRLSFQNTSKKIVKKTIVLVPSFKVVCDNMLQGLGRQLRSCGIDTAILNNLDSHDLAANIARSEKRIILTSGAPFQYLSSRVPVGSCLDIPNDLKAKDQLKFVLDHYNVLVRPSDIFSRCQICNCGKYLKVSTADMRQIISFRGKVPKEPDPIPWHEFRSQLNLNISPHVASCKNARIADDISDDDDDQFFIVDDLDDKIKQASDLPNQSYTPFTKSNRTKSRANTSSLRFSAPVQSSSRAQHASYTLNPRSLSDTSRLDINTGEIVTSDKAAGSESKVGLVYKQVPKPVCDQVPEFYCCINCGKVYWDGLHFSNTLEKFNDVITK